MDVVKLFPRAPFVHVGASLILFENSSKYWYFKNSNYSEPDNFINHTQSILHHRTRFYATSLKISL
eukprot:Pgem_evm1s17716